MFNQKFLKSKPKNPSKAQPLDSIPSFIRKTYEILEENKFPDYIDWNAEGTAIIIKMPAEFAQKVLPTYFKHNNLTSFVRQLNMYNFHKKRTQNLDHIYFHDLFQRGKKHLLKEIKRKNHDSQLQMPEKSPVLYHSHSSHLPDALSEGHHSGDMNSLAYENQFLRRLYNDAMAKSAALENQVADLSASNQSLWSQLCQLKGQGTPSMTESTASCYNGSRRDSFASVIGRPPCENYKDEEPVNSDVNIPPLKLNNIMGETQQIITSLRANNSKLAKHPIENVNNFLSFCEDSTNSSDASPSLQVKCSESEKDLNPTGQKSYNNGNLLKVSRQDISLGQILEDWEESQENDSIAFTDQKENFDSTNCLGKRPLEGNYNVSEPNYKRNHYDHVTSFGRKEATPMSSDEKEIEDMMVKRETELVEDYDVNGNVDLMDFNGYNWTKAI